MAVAENFLYRVNQQVLPAGDHPTRCAVFHPQPATDVVNFNSRPGGVQGRTLAILTWEDMPVSAREWFDAFLGAGNMSVTLSDLVLPDSDSAYNETVTEGGLDYPKHGVWTSADLWRVILPEGYTEDYKIVGGSRVRYIIGTCTIRITNMT